MVLQNILMDTEFYKTIDELMECTAVNNSAAKEHISEIERCIYTVKQSSHAIVSTLPFR